MSDETIWVAIEVRRDERAGHKCLTAEGFACLYTATERRIVTRGRNGKPRHSAVIEWALPGYIVLAHDGRPGFWQRLAVVKFPCTGQPVMRNPVRIAGSDVVPATAVREMVMRSGTVVVEPEAPQLSSGQRARILADVFAGHVGRIGSINGVKATLWLDVFGRSTKIVTDVGNLQAA